MIDGGTTKLGVIRVRVIDAATPAALQTAVNDFLRGAGTPVVTEQRFIGIHYQMVSATVLSAMIIYVE